MENEDNTTAQETQQAPQQQASQQTPQPAQQAQAPAQHAQQMHNVELMMKQQQEIHQQQIKVLQAQLKEQSQKLTELSTHNIELQTQHTDFIQKNALGMLTASLKGKGFDDEDIEMFLRIEGFTQSEKPVPVLSDDGKIMFRRGEKQYTVDEFVDNGTKTMLDKWKFSRSVDHNHLARVIKQQSQQQQQVQQQTQQQQVQQDPFAPISFAELKKESAIKRFNNTN